jgi:hypothetical protein
MKIKHTILALGITLASLPSIDAATMLISNVSNGPGDTLWALNNNTPMSNGVVVMGYFPASVLPSEINTIGGLVSKLSQFVSVSTVDISAVDSTLSGAFNGYAESSGAVTVPGSPLNAGNALLGRTVYQIVTNASSLGVATASNEFALLSYGTFLGDQPVEQPFDGNPTLGQSIISGGVGSFVVNDGSFYENGTYSTLKLATAIPEPSTALLGAIGAMALLRRRRN